jgi:predicted PurR-regulated permease PerM
MNYLKSQLILMVFIGVMTYIVNRIVGLPFAFVLAVVAGGCEVIPRIGPIISTAAAAIVALLQGSNTLPLKNWQFAVLVVLLYGLIQLLENWLIQPKIVGSVLNMHPIITIVGMAAFGSVLGVFGVIIAVPVMATVREIVFYLFYEEKNQDSRL